MQNNCNSLRIQGNGVPQNCIKKLRTISFGVLSTVRTTTVRVSGFLVHVEDAYITEMKYFTNQR